MDGHGDAADLLLRAGAWTATLRPPVGGAVASLTRDGAPMLRPSPADADDPLALACFPLVPYANRVAHGRLAFGGETWTLPRNHPAQAHPLHGVGWLRAWDVTATDTRRATLRHAHPADAAWPWSYEAIQVVALAEDGLSLTLSVCNTDAGPMPASIGLHPYFARSGAQVLRFEAAGVWLADGQMLPTEHASASALGDPAIGLALDRPDLVDYCYTGWIGRATIARADGDLVIEATGADLLHVFLPPGAPFFCAEPVTAMPDAISRGQARVLAPGETTTVAMRITGR